MTLIRTTKKRTTLEGLARLEDDALGATLRVKGLGFRVLGFRV